MTNYNFGDVVLVPFPFTDQTATNQRPTVVVSYLQYIQSRPDLILMAITSRVRKSLLFGEIEISQWQSAGLLKPSLIKPVFTTIKNSLVKRLLGNLESLDTNLLRNEITNILR